MKRLADGVLYLTTASRLYEFHAQEKEYPMELWLRTIKEAAMTSAERSYQKRRQEDDEKASRIRGNLKFECGFEKARYHPEVAEQQKRAKKAVQIRQAHEKQKLQTNRKDTKEYNVTL